MPHDYKTVNFSCKSREFCFLSDSGVFSKNRIDPASRLLLENVEPFDGNLCDMGCGYGFLGIVLGALNNAKVTLADVNERVLPLAKKNCAANGISADIVLSDGFENISESYDVIVTNPPVRAGKQTVFRIYEGAYNHLKHGGRFYAVIRKKHGALSSEAKLLELFGNCSEAARESGIFVYCCEKVSVS